MLRKCRDENISDVECEKIINPFCDNYHSYLEEYIMPEVLTNDLKKLKNEAKKINGFNEIYFVADDAFSVSPNALADHKNTNCELARVKQIRLHDFRHSCASLLINKGANVKIVAKYLGHTKKEETLKTYAHLFLSSLDEIIDGIDNLDK